MYPPPQLPSFLLLENLHLLLLCVEGSSPELSRAGSSSFITQPKWHFHKIAIRSTYLKLPPSHPQIHADLFLITVLLFFFFKSIPSSAILLFIFLFYCQNPSIFQGKLKREEYLSILSSIESLAPRITTSHNKHSTNKEEKTSKL